MPLRGIRRIAGAVASAALVLAACSDSITFDSSLAGTYDLVRVNGSALPYNLPGTAAGVTATIKSGSLIIADNARFTETFTTHLVRPDTTVDANATTIGDISASNGTASFEPRFEDHWTGTYTATTITYTKAASATVNVTYEWHKHAN